MTSRFYGVACCVTICVTCLAYSSVFQAVARETSTRRPVDHQVAQLDWPRTETGTEETLQVALAKAEKGTSLAAVGWEGCPWCEKLKEETLPDLVAQGYDVRYVDISDWKGPKVKTGPTLFFFADKNRLVHTHKGFMTVEQVKEHLDKP